MAVLVGTVLVMTKWVLGQAKEMQGTALEVAMGTATLWGRMGWGQCRGAWERMGWRCRAGHAQRWMRRVRQRARVVTVAGKGAVGWGVMHLEMEKDRVSCGLTGWQMGNGRVGWVGWLT